MSKTVADKSAHLALRRSEEKFRRLVEGLSHTHCVFSHSPDGIFLYVSPGFKAVFGYDPDEFTGRNWRELNFAPESIEQGSLADHRVLQEGVFQTVELLYNHPDGSRRFIEIVYGPVYEDGQLVAMEGICVDVSERRRVLEELQRGEELYRSIVAVLNGGVWEYHRDTGYLWCSKEYFAMLGFAADECKNTDKLDIQKDWIEILHPDDREAASRLFFDYINSDTEALYENRFRLRCRDGSYINIWSRGKNLGNSNRLQNRVTVGIHIDVSEQSRAEEALRTSEKNYREIFNATSEAIFIHDAISGQILDVNETTVKMYGFENKQQLIGCPLSYLSVNDSQFSEENAISRVRAMEHRGPDQFEWMARRRNGEVFPVEVALSRSTIGGYARVIAVVRDISEKKKLLESAQRADKLESLGILAGGIAHDFNNLLGGIYGYLELAKKSSENAEVRSSLDSCIGTIGRARSLTKQLLTFAKGGKPDCKVQELFPFLEETVRFALSGSHVSARFFKADNLPPGNFDRAQLEQVIDNIVINAVQSMSEGGIIEVSVCQKFFETMEHHDLSRGDYLKVSFKDQGSGIARELMAHIFDPFFSTKSGGHGMGLATCYSIVKNHHGCIEVESEPGKGSIFHVFIPAVARVFVASKPEKRQTHHGQGLVLIMDDEESIRNTVGSILESFGYSVVSASSGNEVIDLFQNGFLTMKGVSAMLFDLTIPGGMGGRETLEAIRKLGCEAPAFVMSGYADNVLMLHPQEAGFMASIRKPFTISDLAAVLNRFLKN
ncbi:MAG: PAS domain S-box protein [Candidatus Riflebacteria bacterium]|nr:PAS domain S-box protein [Candidatus Riflebacteria bacterium]